MNENERSSGRTQVPQSDQNSETPRTAQLDNDIESLTIEVFFDCKILSFLAFFLFFIFPLLPLFLATVFGGLFALCEPDTTFKQGFLYVVSNLLGMGNPLTSYNPSYTSVAIVIDMYVAITALVCFGIMLNVVNLFQVPEAMNSLIERVTKNTFLVPLHHSWCYYRRHDIIDGVGIPRDLR